MVQTSKLNNENSLLKDDYNLPALVEAKPWKDNFSMLVTPRFKSVYENGYEMFSTRIAKNFMKKSDLFVDVGANYGYYSLLAAHSNEQAHIIAIEPVEENFLVLKKNIELNHIPEKQIDCINAAASSTAGTIKLYKSEASDNSSIIPHPNSQTLQQIEVQAVILDQLLSDVDSNESVFLKIDTDGNELDVLQGFTETIKRIKDVTILIEINPKLFKLTNASYADIANFLGKNDFMVYAVDDNAFRYYPLDNPENISMMLGLFEQTYFNILCVREEKALSVALFSHSAELGGAERSLLDLITGLSEMGGLCTAILPYDGCLIHALREVGCAVYTLPQGLNQTISWWWAETGRYSDCMGITKLPSSINAIKDTLIPEIRKIKPDVIFSQTIVTPWGAIIAEMLGIPHAISAREYGVLDHKLKFLFDFSESMDALYKTSDAVFCISHDVKDTIFGEDIDNKVDVIYSNIQINAANMLATINPELNIVDDPSSIKVGIFGNIVESKGQKDIVRACIELLKKGKKITCYLVGYADQAYFEEIIGIINNSGHKDSFVLPGFIDKPYPLMNLMNIVVSCSEREALGRTLLEAVLLNKPIIYSNSGGPKEIFADGIHGLAYEHGNHMELADKIEYSIANEAETQARINKASEHVNILLNSQNYSGKVYSKLSQLKSNGRFSTSRGVIDLVDKYKFNSLPSRTFYSKLFFAESEAHFTEIKSLVTDGITYGLFNIVCDLPDDGYTCIRFDPLEGELIELAIYRTEFIGFHERCDVKQIKCYSNGAALGDNSWEFNNYDPQVIYQLNGQVKQIRIIGELRKVYPQKTITFLNQEIEQKNQEIEQKSQEIEQIINSISWKITAPLRMFGQKDRKAIMCINRKFILCRKGVASLRHTGLRATLGKIRNYKYYNKIEQEGLYDLWLKNNSLTGNDAFMVKRNIDKLTYKPLISIILPVYNVEEKWLRKCIDSVINQLYPNWELCIADDASTEPYICKVLDEYKEKDQRIKVVYREINGHISAASNSALKLATGEFVALLDNDDELTVDALYENVLLLNIHPEADMIYSDEDKINEDGRRHSPFFKPDWSPDTFLSQMYTCHLGVYRASLVKEIDGFRVGYEGSQDYDLVLRLTEKTHNIFHIPKVLYSWRLTNNSTSLNPHSKPYAHLAGVKAINSYLESQYDNKGTICDETGVTFVYNVRYETTNNPKVSIIVPTRDQLRYLKACINSINELSTYTNYEIIILNNNSIQSETIEWLNCVACEKIKIIDASYEFNWAKLNNHGMSNATGDVYVFLNNDTKIISHDWLERLTENAMREEIGTVGCMLLYHDDTIQHAGVVVGMNGWADHIYKGLKPAHYITSFLSPIITRNVLASTGACLAVSKTTISKIGGFKEDFIQCGSDIELSIRAYESGLYNLYIPMVKLYHYESKTRNPLNIPESDFEQSALYYKRYIEDGDPFYNKNLSLCSLIPRLK